MQEDVQKKLSLCNTLYAVYTYMRLFLISLTPTRLEIRFSPFKSLYTYICSNEKPLPKIQTPVKNFFEI